jgi:predicted ATPase
LTWSVDAPGTHEDRKAVDLEIRCQIGAEQAKPLVLSRVGELLARLRAFASLWLTQRRHDEARKLLTPVYRKFADGFDTADLRHAKALLDEIRTGRPEARAPLRYPR